MTVARSRNDSDPNDADLLSGRYALGSVIGRGSSAVVHRAVDTLTGAEVAVKLFMAGASALDERRRRQELAALGAVDHPGLVRLLGGGTTQDRPYVVMDLVEGPTLAQRLVSGPLPAREVCALGAGLAEALAHVHSLGFVHRDVKPANVLLAGGGTPRLADFGIARALDDTSATATGFIVGTAAFLAPEQVRGEAVGPRADVYALGLVLLEALNGRREFPGAAVESATARLHRAPRVPHTVLGGVLAAMTASEPRDRLDAAGAAAALAAVRDPDEFLTVAADPPPKGRPSGADPDDPAAVPDEPATDRTPARAHRRLRRVAVPAAVVAMLAVGLTTTVAVLGTGTEGGSPAAASGRVVAVPVFTAAPQPSATRPPTGSTPHRDPSAGGVAPGAAAEVPDVLEPVPADGDDTAVVAARPKLASAGGAAAPDDDATSGDSGDGGGTDGSADDRPAAGPTTPPSAPADSGAVEQDEAAEDDEPRRGKKKGHLRKALKELLKKNR